MSSKESQSNRKKSGKKNKEDQENECLISPSTSQMESIVGQPVILSRGQKDSKRDTQTADGSLTKTKHSSKSAGSSLSDSSDSGDDDAGSYSKAGTDAGSRRTADTDAGYRRTTDAGAGSRRTADADAGSRRTADADAGSRRTTDTDAGYRRTTDADGKDKMLTRHTLESGNRDQERATIHGRGGSAKDRDAISISEESSDYSGSSSDESGSESTISTSKAHHGRGQRRSGDAAAAAGKSKSAGNNNDGGVQGGKSGKAAARTPSDQTKDKVKDKTDGGNVSGGQAGQKDGQKGAVLSGESEPLRPKRFSLAVYADPPARKAVIKGNEKLPEGATKETAKAYLQRHKIKELFDMLLAAVVNVQPEHPVDFLHDIAKEMNRQRSIDLEAEDKSVPCPCEKLAHV